MDGNMKPRMPVYYTADVERTMDGRVVSRYRITVSKDHDSEIIYTRITEHGKQLEAIIKAPATGSMTGAVVEADKCTQSNIDYSTPKCEEGHWTKKTRMGGKECTLYESQCVENGIPVRKEFCVASLTPVGQRITVGKTTYEEVFTFVDYVIHEPSFFTAPSTCTWLPAGSVQFPLRLRAEGASVVVVPGAVPRGDAPHPDAVSSASTGDTTGYESTAASSGVSSAAMSSASSSAVRSVRVPRASSSSYSSTGSSGSVESDNKQRT